MGAAKREQLEAREAEYAKEMSCPKCGGEREEYSFDSDTVLFCEMCDAELDEIYEPADLDLAAAADDFEPPC